MPPSRARRWLLLADFCAVILAVITTESGAAALRLERPALLKYASAYLIVTGIILFFISRRTPQTAAPSPGTSILGRRGPAFLAYMPRFILGVVLLIYAFRS